MSPKTILLFSVAYMGCVILLHIFGKVTSIKAKKNAATATPDPTDTGAGDLWEIKGNMIIRIITINNKNGRCVIFNNKFTNIFTSNNPFLFIFS